MLLIDKRKDGASEAHPLKHFQARLLFFWATKGVSETRNGGFGCCVTRTAGLVNGTSCGRGSGQDGSNKQEST